MLALVLLSAACNSAVAGPIKTSFGKIFGHAAKTRDGQQCEEFLGIPFAEKPPRFAPPSPWTTHYGAEGLVAATYAPFCPQMNGISANGDEDCLFLNIWRPREISPGDSLAIMVWIFGGAFVSGDGGDKESPNTYDGCGLAAQHGVIVASMNYRLGPLGFGALTNRAGGVDANWGLEDQREALRWLQREISAFGGSSKKVTIFGESAGAESVWHHLASERSTGLFRAAISESGAPYAVGSKFGINRTANFAKIAGCKGSDSAEIRRCLMTKSAAELITIAARQPASYEQHWGPTVDGFDLTDYPDELFRRNQTKAVPILIGTNTDEGTIMIFPIYPEGMNESQYRDFVTAVFTHRDRSLTDADLAKVLHLYPPVPGKDLRLLASTLSTDAVFLCRDLDAVASLSTKAPTFVYRFNHRPTCPRPSPFIPGTYHGMELPYVFGTPNTYECSFTPEEQALSKRMQIMWTNFAKNLNPSILGEPFPEYTAMDQKSTVLQTSSDTTDNGYRASFCKVWSEIWTPKEDLPASIIV